MSSQGYYFSGSLDSGEHSRDAIKDSSHFLLFDFVPKDKGIMQLRVRAGDADPSCCPVVMMILLKDKCGILQRMVQVK